jgi:hypothetical protein
MQATKISRLYSGMKRSSWNPAVNQPTSSTVKRARTGRRVKVAADFEVDLKAAGIDFIDSKGRRLDFRALQYTYIMGLFRAGARPDFCDTICD